MSTTSTTIKALDILLGLGALFTIAFCFDLMFFPSFIIKLCGLLLLAVTAYTGIKFIAWRRK